MVVLLGERFGICTAPEAENPFLFMFKYQVKTFGEFHICLPNKDSQQ